MDRLNILELIQLYVAGCISAHEKEVLKSLMDDAENFPWDDLGEYQNLMVQIPLSLEKVEPTVMVKEKLIRKLKKYLVSEGIAAGQNLDYLQEVVEHKKQPEKFEQKSKIDWGSLSLPETKTYQPEVISRKQPVETIKNEAEKVQPSNTTAVISEEFVKPARKETVKKNKKNFSAIGGIRKYAIISALVVVVGVSVFTFLNLKNSDDKVQKEQIVSEQVNIPVSTEQNLVVDSTEMFAAVEESEPVEKEEQVKEEKKEKQKEILPTPPPKNPMIDESSATEIKQNVVVDDKIEQRDIEEIKTQTDSPPNEIVETKEEPAFFVAVEEMPEPIGGLKSIQQKIVYPEIAKKVGVEGRVYIRAFVDEKGNVINAEVVKGIGAGCDEAALNAVKNTAFKPGKQRGKPVKVQVTVPIVFKR